MKKTIKNTKSKVAAAKTIRPKLDIGELDQVYGGMRSQDPGTKG
jgi:hypothetical protein